MDKHLASEQMIGYLYQVRYALALLLECDNPHTQISIEKFDDIAFSSNGTPEQLIQVKHHVRQHGSLSDASIDLWRTLKIWMDAVSRDNSMVPDTKFTIITTAKAPDNSASSLLKNDDMRDPEAAYNRLKTVCDSSKSKENASYYDTFLHTDQVLIRKLFDMIYVIDCASNIINTEKAIRARIRYSCIPKYEDHIIERLEGWWYKKAIEALCSDIPIYITQNQIRSWIVFTCHEYSDDNLPIEVWDIENIDPNTLSTNERAFYEQLRLICIGNSRMRIAIRDYYKAFNQRASWVRNDILYLNELEEYEQRLIDEWEHSFSIMQDSIAEYGSRVSEGIKAKYGRNLLSSIEQKDIHIRPRCQESFVMRGSYHILANQLKVGWHIDFLLRIKELLSA